MWMLHKNAAIALHFKIQIQLCGPCLKVNKSIRGAATKQILFLIVFVK